MRDVYLQCGERLPVLGLGTWRMGESAPQRARELAAVRRGLEMGYRLIDTAEMYGEGNAEEIVGQAIAEALRAGTVAREDLFVVSKVYPHNASREGVAEACDRSRRRLGLEAIDLYLLHWRGTHPLSATVSGFEMLRAAGVIRHWGVSNFDTDDLDELWQVSGGHACAANQVYYSLSERGPEFELMPWQAERGMPLMAYSPLDQGRLPADRRLRGLAENRGVTPAQLALAWVVARDGVMAIAKAMSEAHLRDNLVAADLRLEASDLAEIDRCFPPPFRKSPLAML